MHEVITRWQGPGASPKLTVMYFDEVFPIADCRSGLATLWQAVDNFLYSTYSWTIETTGREVAALTGALVGGWSETTPYTGAGVGSGGGPVADASQVLIQWKTGQVIDGRMVRGRSFIPGLTREYIAGGNVSDTALVPILAAAKGFATGNTGFGVWHRPTPASAGELVEVSDADVWTEFAVLRQRRG